MQIKQAVNECWHNVISMENHTQTHRPCLRTNLKPQLLVQNQHKRPVTGLQERLTNLTTRTVNVTNGVSFPMVG